MPVDSSSTPGNFSIGACLCYLQRTNKIQFYHFPRWFELMAETNTENSNKSIVRKAKVAVDLENEKSHNINDSFYSMNN